MPWRSGQNLCVVHSAERPGRRTTWPHARRPPGRARPHPSSPRNSATAAARVFGGDVAGVVPGFSGRPGILRRLRRRSCRTGFPPARTQSVFPARSPGQAAAKNPWPGERLRRSRAQAAIERWYRTPSYSATGTVEVPSRPAALSSNPALVVPTRVSENAPRTSAKLGRKSATDSLAPLRSDKLSTTQTTCRWPARPNSPHRAHSRTEHALLPHTQNEEGRHETQTAGRGRWREDFLEDGRVRRSYLCGDKPSKFWNRHLSRLACVADFLLMSEQSCATDDYHVYRPDDAHLRECVGSFGGAGCGG